MQLFLRDNLLFTDIIVAYQGARLEMSHVLIDTGSAKPHPF